MEEGTPHEGISMQAMKEHLASFYVGYRAGDPTAGPPPAQMPQPTVAPPAGMRSINLRQMSMAQLHAEAAATQTRDLFAALLPDPPGVPPDRLAYLTGQAPDQQQQQQQQQQQAEQQKQAGKPEQPTQPQSMQQPQPQQKQKRATLLAAATGKAAAAASSAAAAAAAAGAEPARVTPVPPSGKLSEEELVAILSRYLPAQLGESRPGINPVSRRGSGGGGGAEAPIPWAQLGLAKGGPRIGGVECDLRRLWSAVCQQGGFEAVCAASGWQELASGLGVDTKRIHNGGRLVSEWFRRFLRPYELHLQRQQQRQQPAGKVQAEGQQSEAQAQASGGGRGKGKAAAAAAAAEGQAAVAGVAAGASFATGARPTSAGRKRKPS